MVDVDVRRAQRLNGNAAPYFRPPLKLIYAFYALSGFVSLGYQVSWFRICVNQLGSNNLTFILVVCCFIGGLGTGSLCSRQISSACASLLRIRNPLRIYGVVECLISITMLLTVGWVAFSPNFAGSFPYTLQDGIYFQTLPYQLGQVAQVVVCVFVPCFFMGVTFPLLCAAFVQHERFFPRHCTYGIRAVPVWACSPANFSFCGGSVTLISCIC